MKRTIKILKSQTIRVIGLRGEWFAILEHFGLKLRLEVDDIRDLTILKQTLHNPHIVIQAFLETYGLGANNH